MWLKTRRAATAITMTSEISMVSFLCFNWSDSDATSDVTLVIVVDGVGSLHSTRTRAQYKEAHHKDVCSD